jgi:hypothetical protein
MKQTDLTRPVMQKIIKFEINRSRRQWNNLIIILLILIVSLLSATTLFINQLLERGTLDVIELFQEDYEVISEYWKEAFDTFLAELPRDTMLFIGIISLIIVVFILITRRRIMIIKKRMQQIKDYEKIRHQGGDL